MGQAHSVVLVGTRRAAARAARGSGRLVIEIVTDGSGSPRDGVDLRLAADPAASDASWRETAARLSAYDPLAVLAVGEAAVLPAARLRAALDPSRTGDIEVARRCTDKLLMKRAIRRAGLPCAEIIGDEGPLDGAALARRLGYPFHVKQRVGSGSRGSRRVDRGDDLDFLLEEGRVAERHVAGVEMSVEALVCGGEPVFVNCTEYLEPLWANVVPASLDPSTTEAVTGLLRRALPALGVAEGFVHLELFLTGAGPVFGELAWRPPGGHIMTLIRLAYGVDPWQAWLDAACGLDPRLPPEPQRFAGVRLFHPGPGVIATVPPADLLDDVEGVRKLVVRVKPGRHLGPRVGSGQEAAHVIACADDRATVVAALDEARRRVRLEVAHDA